MQSLRRGERIVGITAVVLFFVMFFDWYDVKVSGGGISASTGGNAWQVFGFTDLLLFVTIVVAIVLVAMTARGGSPARLSAALTGLTALSALTVLIRLVSPPDGGMDGTSFGGVSIDVDVSPTIWAFLGFIVVLAMLYGSVLAMRERDAHAAPVAAA